MDTAVRNETRDTIVALGVMAVGLHQAAHRLPAPLSIDLPSVDEPEAYVRVRIAAVGDQQRWLNTVHVNHQIATPFDSYERITWHVRLPETGTRVQLVGLRDSGEQPARGQAVPA